MKVYAKIRAVRRTPAPQFDVEYVLLYGDVRSDCVALTPAAYSNEIGFTFAIKQALRAYLNATYAPETFSSGDILLFG